MKLLETEPPDSRGYVLPRAQIVSLFLTGCVVWTVVTAPPFFPNSLSMMIGRAVGFAVLAWLWTAATLAGLCFFFAEGISDHLQRILRTSTAAVWFAPAAILLTERSAAVVLAGLILVVNTTWVLCSDWRLAQAETDQALPILDADGLFQPYALPSPTFYRQLAPGVALSFFVQAGAVAAMMHYPLLAAGCFAFSAAFLTAFGMDIGIINPERPRNPTRSVFGVILTVLLAAGLTLGGSLKPGTAPNSSGTPGQPATPMPGYEPGAAHGKVGDNDFPGVILWPEIKAVTKLVAPVPAGTSFSAHSAHALGIPFSGEYWMFREPYRRPPYGSFFERGSPAGLGFRTSDHVPLQMEAHHRLDQHIDLSCCSKVQIAIWNADQYPGTVALEIILIDTDRPRRLSLSLGTAAVRSSPAALPVRETLEFPIPTKRALEQFNEFKVVFHRDRERGDRSARIEIDRFVLVPARTAR